MAEFMVVDGWTVGQLIRLLRSIPSNTRIFVGKEGGGSAAEYSNHVLLMLTQFGNEKRLLIGGIGAHVTYEELKNSIQAWDRGSTCNAPHDPKFREGFDAWMKDRQKENDTACGFTSTVSLDDGISQNAISILAQKERENENSSKS